MRTLTALASTALAFTPGLAAAAEPPCLTRAEFTSVASYALPSIITGTTQRCATTLPSGAYLRTSGKTLAGRYASQKDKHWAGAKAVFVKASSNANKLFGDMPDSSLQPILEAMVEGMISQQIPLDRCTSIDRLVALLSPLPPENLAEAIAIAVGLGAKTADGRSKVGKLSICQG